MKKYIIKFGNKEFTAESDYLGELNNYIEFFGQAAIYIDMTWMGLLCTQCNEFFNSDNYIRVCNYVRTPFE